jgi:hypothetical protein
MDYIQNHVAVTLRKYLNIMQQKAMDKEATKQLKKKKKNKRKKKNKQKKHLQH